MFVRGYQMSDCKEITELFYNTVHTINAKDYTKEQLDVYPYDSEFTKRLMIVVAK